jgi:hypothetical protein
MGTPRYSQGDALPASVPVATAQAIARWDIVGLNSNTLVRASDTVWDTNLLTTQTDFQTFFAGVSMQDKLANIARVYGNDADNNIEIQTSGVIEMDCVQQSFNVGDYIGPAKDTGNALLNQKVDKTASSTGSIGRVTEATNNGTTVKFFIISTKFSE